MWVLEGFDVSDSCFPIELHSSGHEKIWQSPYGMGRLFSEHLPEVSYVWEDCVTVTN